MVLVIEKEFLMLYRIGGTPVIIKPQSERTSRNVIKKVSVDSVYKSCRLIAKNFDIGINITVESEENRT